MTSTATTLFNLRTNTFGYVLLLVGLLGLLLVHNIEQSRNDAQRSNNTESVQPGFLERFLDRVSPPVIIHLCRDLMISFAVAGVLVLTIEKHHKSTQNQLFESFQQALDKSQGGFLNSLKEKLEERMRQVDDDRLRTIKEHQRTIQRHEEDLGVFMRSVGASFLHAAFGRALPENLWTRIRSTILECDFVRKDYRVEIDLDGLSRLDLKKLPSEMRERVQRFIDSWVTAGNKLDNVCLFRCSASYKIKNVQDAPKTYRVMWNIVNDYYKYPDSCLLTKITVNNVPVSVCHEKNDGPEYSAYHDESLAPNDEVAVKISTYSVKRVDDAEPWAAIIPSDGMEVKVRDVNDEFDVVLQAYLPLSPDDKSCCEKQGGEVEMTLNKYLLPYQGVLVKWRHRPYAAPTGSPTVSPVREATPE